MKHTKNKTNKLILLLYDILIVKSILMCLYFVIDKKDPMGFMILLITANIFLCRDDYIHRCNKPIWED